MTKSRRSFLGAGLMAAICAAFPTRVILGQSWKDRDGNPGNNPPAQTDLLALYSKATFKSYVGSIFQLHTFAGVVSVTLMEVDDMPAAKGGECFALEFRGGSLPVRQDTYTLVHPSLGTFQLLLVPAGTDQNGAQGYVATINRLSYVDLLNNPAPLKGDGSTRTTVPTTKAPTTTTAPSAKPVTPPATQSPSTPTIPSPKATPGPLPKRKPSWKDFDIQNIDADIGEGEWR